MMIVTIIGFVMGVVGGISGVVSVVYTRKQARVMQEEMGRMLRQDTRAEEWAKKYDESAALLTRIFPRKFPTGPSVMTGAYTYIFRSDKFARANRNIPRAPDLLGSVSTDSSYRGT